MTKNNNKIKVRVSLESNVLFSRDVTATMLVYRTIVRKLFWEFDSITMQNLNNILPLFCTPTWPSQHVSENQELFPWKFRFLFMFFW